MNIHSVTKVKRTDVNFIFVFAKHSIVYFLQINNNLIKPQWQYIQSFG